MPAKGPLGFCTSLGTAVRWQASAYKSSDGLLTIPVRGAVDKVFAPCSSPCATSPVAVCTKFDQAKQAFFKAFFPGRGNRRSDFCTALAPKVCWRFCG
ncbi:hypothetical protein C3L29_011485 [Pseudomonas sp. MWU12-2534b]|nr:hypothetical protein C3L29_011485 [Pseudomonas sp. MWU12-2534b]